MHMNPTQVKGALLQVMEAYRMLIRVIEDQVTKYRYTKGRLILGPDNVRSN